MNTVEVVRLEGRKFVPERLEIRQVRRSPAVANTAQDSARLAEARRELGLVPERQTEPEEQSQAWEAVPSMTFRKALFRWFVGSLARFIEMITQGVTRDTKKDWDEEEASAK